MEPQKTQSILKKIERHHFHVQKPKAVEVSHETPKTVEVPQTKPAEVSHEVSPVEAPSEPMEKGEDFF